MSADGPRTPAGSTDSLGSAQREGTAAGNAATPERAYRSAGRDDDVKWPDANQTREWHARRAARGAMFGLIAVASAFFLPAVRGCNTMVVPAQLSVGSPIAAGWVVPPYLVALVLAVLTARAWLTSQPPSRRLNVVTRAVAYLGVAVVTTISLAGAMGGPRLAAILIVSGVCLGFVTLALRRPTDAGWLEWRNRHIVWCVLCLPHLVVQGAAAVHDLTTTDSAPRSTGIGAWMFVLGWITVVISLIVGAYGTHSDFARFAERLPAARRERTS